MDVFKEAIDAAQNAAWGAAGSEYWMFDKADKKEKAAWAKALPELAAFVAENPTAPPDAAFIRAGALGVHDGTVSFADQPAGVRLGYKVFVATLLQVNGALAENAQEAEALARAAEAEELARAHRPIGGLSDEALRAAREGTPLEQLGSPLDLSEAGREAARRAEEQRQADEAAARAAADQAAAKTATATGDDDHAHA